MHIVEVLGRIFISSLFIVEAIRKFFSPDEGMIYMSDYGVPEILFYPSLIFEFVVPLILIAGFKTRFFASLLFLFVLSVTVIFHTDFSNNMQMISFLKNLAIMGGLLIIISNKPQMCSIDYYLESKKGN
jgi:putative oxidoreductase